MIIDVCSSHSVHAKLKFICNADGNSRTKDVEDDWPICYNCDKPVFYDKSLGFFIYCSPACRDEHALPEYDEKLRQDIRELRIPQKMESHTVILETSPKKSSGFLFLKHFEQKQVSYAKFIFYYKLCTADCDYWSLY